MNFSQLVKGLNNNDIVEQLVVSRSTAKFHISSVLSKQGTSSQTKAVVVVRQNDLVM